MVVCINILNHAELSVSVYTMGSVIKMKQRENITSHAQMHVWLFNFPSCRNYQSARYYRALFFDCEDAYCLINTVTVKFDRLKGETTIFRSDRSVSACGLVILQLSSRYQDAFASLASA